MDEKILAALSTTEKDFNSIWAEELDLTKTLTNRWDPSQSNESDPGVVLLKELAILGDKLNYNIDKNVLECFPLSVTQLGNARMLYDELGYKMHWYKSGIGQVAFKLKKSLSDLGINDSYFKIPEFTELTNSGDSSVLYTTLESASLDTVNQAVSVPVIQGKVHTLTVNGNEFITLADLDEDLRIYLPETMVAENGIFINTYGAVSFTDGTAWKNVDNLESYDGGNKVFEFKISADGTQAYIQFPQDIATVMQQNDISALTIKYTTTAGLSGNIKSQTLDTFVNELQVTNDSKTISMNENIKVIQYYAITDGVNYETIDEAYRGYKKSGSVHNTIITKKDYESYIYYNAKDSETKTNLVSNVIVADQTNDINRSNSIQTWSLSGNEKQLVHTNDITPYDVYFYLTRPSTSLNSVYNYDTTYVPMYSDNGNDDKVLKQIDAELGDIRAIQHKLHLPNDGDLCNIDNLIAVKGIIYTYNKVTEADAKNIQKNVLNALWKKCNARELNYGEELTYDELVDIITSADTNIKTFALTEVSGNKLEFVLGDNKRINESNSVEYKAQMQKMIARMILSGNVQLIKFDDSFVYDFGQSEVTNLGSDDNPITKITTTASITVPSEEGNAYLIKPNEVVQLYAPNLIISETFGGYGLTVSTNNQDSITLPAKQIIKLNDNTSLRFNNIAGVDGEVVRTGVFVRANSVINIPAGGEYRLQSNQQIDILNFNKNSIGGLMQYYFITKDTVTKDNVIYYEWTHGNNAYILQDGEYVWYASPNDLTDIIFKGPGTEVKFNFVGGTGSIQCKQSSTETLGQELDWQQIAPGDSINFTEMQIKSFAEGCKCYANKALVLTNADTPLQDNDKFYATDSLTTQFNLINDTIKNQDNNSVYSGYVWKIHSRLNLNATKENPQYIESNQTITYKCVTDAVDTTIDTGKYVVFNYPVVMNGGDNLDMAVLTDGGESKYLLTGHSYLSDSNEKYKRTNGYIEIPLSSLTKNNYTLDYGFKENSIYSSYIIPIYANVSNSAEITVKLGDTELGVFNGSEPTKRIKSDDKTYLYSVTKEGNAINLSITLPQTTDTIRHSDKLYYNLASGGSGYTEYTGNEVAGKYELVKSDKIYVGFINKLEGTNFGDETDALVSQMQQIDKNNIFDWTYRVPENAEVINPTSPSSFWNKNHIYNQYTISKIDFANTSITVSPTNIK